jgi:hypothetical protein
MPAQAGGLGLMREMTMSDAFVGKGRQTVAPGNPSNVSLSFPVLQDRAFSVELSGIEPLASRVRFWRRDEREAGIGAR